MTFTLHPITPCRKDMALLSVFAAIAALLAVHFGWMNVDGWNYLALADNLRNGYGLSVRPSWGNSYWAIFPGGYPALLAFISAIVPVDTLLLSKLVNAALLVACAWFSAKLTRIPLLLAAMVFLSWPWLEITSNSWSENLFVCAMLAAFYALFQYIESAKSRWLLWYVLALVVMSTSRYIGGFFIGAYVLAIALAIPKVGRLRAASVLMATMVAGTFFAVYMVYNIHVTGYPTGIRRAKADEGFMLLAEIFLNQSFLTTLGLLLSPLLLLLASRAKRITNEADHYRVYALALPGAAYLLLLFVLRMHSRFELFGNRMVLPGLLLIVLALLAHLWQGRDGALLTNWRSRAILAVLTLANLGVLYAPLLANPPLLMQEGLRSSMHRYDTLYGALPEGTALIVPAYLISGWRIDSPAFTSDRIFVVQIQDYPFKLDGYKEFLHELRYKGQAPKYSFDFNEFGTIEELDKELKERGADPALAEWIKAHFAPGQFVECHDCSTR